MLGLLPALLLALPTVHPFKLGRYAPAYWLANGAYYHLFSLRPSPCSLFLLLSSFSLSFSSLSSPNPFPLGISIDSAPSDGDIFCIPWPHASRLQTASAMPQPSTMRTTTSNVPSRPCLPNYGASTNPHSQLMATRAAQGPSRCTLPASWHLHRHLPRPSHFPSCPRSRHVTLCLMPRAIQAVTDPAEGHA